VDRTGAGATYSSEDLSRSREELQAKDVKDAEFVPKLKDHLRKLAERLKDKADNYHKAPPEEEGTFVDLKGELQGVYDDLSGVVQRMLDLAGEVLESRSDLKRLGIARAQLKSFLDDVYGDAYSYLSAAAKVAAGYRMMESRGVLQAESAQALTRGARDAANAYLHFAETFEGMVGVVQDLADRVMKAVTKPPEGRAR
jgi:hypothetical protein